MLKTKTYVGLDSLPAQYSGLFAEASESSFFLSLPWFRNFERSVLDSNEFTQIIGVETLEPSSLPVGALVLKASRCSRRLLRQLTVDSLTNYYSSYFAPILARRRDSNEIVTMLARELHYRRAQWDVLNLRPVDLSSAIVKRFYAALTELGFRTQTYFCFGNWYLNVSGRSYAEYFNDLPSVIRKNIPYYRRRLEKIARFKIAVYKSTEDVKPAIHDYETIYNSSWRKPEGNPNFVRGLIHTAAEQKWLRLGVCYVGDEPAAAQLWIVHRGIASIYKICYAEKFAKYSIGSVLTAHMLEQVLDIDRVVEVDYLTGDDSYKASWMSARRERWGIIAFNPKSIWGKVGIVRHIGGKNLKSTWDRLYNSFVDSNKLLWTKDSK